ncbi:MAG: NAD(+)/NADH kinase [Verrucomicrobiales bacterium]
MDRKGVGVTSRLDKAEVGETVATIVDELRSVAAGRMPVYLDKRLGQLNGVFVAESEAMTLHEMGLHCEVLLVLGGDGTLLNSVSELGADLPAVFGLNLGALGFLTCLPWEDYQQATRAVVERSYVLSPRTFILVEHQRMGQSLRKLRGLNDVVISRGLSSQLIRLEARVGGELITEYYADGLILATPTGSTAYALAAGGPIMTPQAGVFVVTPICPHVLTNRSLIIPDESEIAVTLRSDQSATLAVDGCPGLEIRPGDQLLMRRADERLPLAMLPSTGFFDVLREKLKWTGSNV